MSISYGSLSLHYEVLAGTKTDGRRWRPILPDGTVTIRFITPLKESNNVSIFFKFHLSYGGQSQDSRLSWKYWPVKDSTVWQKPILFSILLIYHGLDHRVKLKSSKLIWTQKVFMIKSCKTSLDSMTRGGGGGMPLWKISLRAVEWTLRHIYTFHVSQTWREICTNFGWTHNPGQLLTSD